MNIADLLLDLTLIFTTSYLLSIGWYPQAVFSGMFFILVQVAKILVVLYRPLPRIVVGAEVVKVEEGNCKPDPQ